MIGEALFASPSDSTNWHPHISVGRRVLIVDDEALLRVTLAEALEEQGYGAIEAASADEAWSRLEDGEIVDLIVSDVRMPGTIDGSELALRVREVNPRIKIVLMSGWSGGRSHVAADAFLGKPFAVETFIDIVAQLIGRADE